MFYEFECTKCDTKFTKKLSVGQFHMWKYLNPQLVNCPKCKRDGYIRNIITGGNGVILKGKDFTKSSIL